MEAVARHLGWPGIPARRSTRAELARQQSTTLVRRLSSYLAGVASRRSLMRAALPRSERR
jgi:hypothetical protein